MQSDHIASQLDQLISRNCAEFDAYAREKAQASQTFMGKNIARAEPCPSAMDSRADSTSSATSPLCSFSGPLSGETELTLLVPPAADGSNPHFLALSLQANSVTSRSVATIPPRLSRAGPSHPPHSPGQSLQMQLARCNYYYEGLSSKVAHEALAMINVPGTYLLRNSNTESDCPLALSMNGFNGPFSVRLKLQDGFYEMMTDQHIPVTRRPSYSNILELINHAVDNANVHRLLARPPGIPPLDSSFKCCPILKTPKRIHNECLKRLRQCPWFHGNMSVTQAHNLLSTQEAGTFLLRKSSQEQPDTPFTLSIKTAAEPISFRIHFCQGLYFTDCTKFTTPSEVSANCVLLLIDMLKEKEFITVLTRLSDDNCKIPVFLSSPLEK